MVGWRVARSLLTLRDQVDAMHPGRNKASDGTIGDAAHTTGEHVPDVFGIVRALDLTNDPGHGFDIDPFSDLLQRGRDPRIKYVIANRMIMSGDAGPDAWLWRNYGGSDPHTGHIHISVVSDDRADSTNEWDLGGTTMALTGNELKLITENVAAAIRRGAWRDGYNDATFDVPYRGGPTLASLEEQAKNLAGALTDVRATLAQVQQAISAPAEPQLDYVKLVDELLRRAAQ